MTEPSRQSAPTGPDDDVWTVTVEGFNAIITKLLDERKKGIAKIVLLEAELTQVRRKLDAIAERICLHQCGVMFCIKYKGHPGAHEA